MTNGEQHILEETVRADLAANIHRIVYHCNLNEDEQRAAINGVIDNAVANTSKALVDGVLVKLHGQLQNKLALLNA